MQLSAGRRMSTRHSFSTVAHTKPPFDLHANGIRLRDNVLVKLKGRGDRKQRTHRPIASTLSEDHDLAGIATESNNIVVDPSQGSNLVPGG